MVLIRASLVEGVAKARTRRNIAALRAVAVVDNYGVGDLVVIGPCYSSAPNDCNLRGREHHIADINFSRSLAGVEVPILGSVWRHRFWFIVVVNSNCSTHR